MGSGAADDGGPGNGETLIPMSKMSVPAARAGAAPLRGSEKPALAETGQPVLAETGERVQKLGMLICLCTIIMAVLDSNIVSAASVPIVRDLNPVHGVSELPWLVTAYALAASMVLPLLGKLSDVYGVKRVFLGSVLAFLTGSALCGMAQSMTELIAFRALQGAGGGGLMSLSMVVMAQLRTLGPEGTKPKSSGVGFGGVIAGAGMAAGPLIGAFFADNLSWRWIFYINLPVGIAVLAGAGLLFRLPRGTGRRDLDVAGALLAACFVTALLLLTNWAGAEYSWTSTPIITLCLCSVACLALFLWRQRRAADPILPLSMFRHPVLRIALSAQAAIGAVLMGGILFTMIYLQSARGISAISASLFLIPMAVAMTAGGIGTARLAGRGWPARRILLTGQLAVTVALVLMGTTGAATPLSALGAELALLGVGFSMLIGQYVLVIQQAAAREQLGVAITSLRLFQTLGGAFGVAVFGTLLNRMFSRADPHATYSELATLAGAARAHAVTALANGIDAVYLSAAGLMALALLLTSRLR
jgi:EmrB/QacA subfamily drug resistance transporter